MRSSHCARRRRRRGTTTVRTVALQASSLKAQSSRSRLYALRSNMSRPPSAGPPEAAVGAAAAARLLHCACVRPAAPLVLPRCWVALHQSAARQLRRFAIRRTRGRFARKAAVYHMVDETANRVVLQAHAPRGGLGVAPVHIFDATILAGDEAAAATEAGVATGGTRRSAGRRGSGSSTGASSASQRRRRRVSGASMGSLASTSASSGDEGGTEARAARGGYRGAASSSASGSHTGGEAPGGSVSVVASPRPTSADLQAQPLDATHPAYVATLLYVWASRGQSCCTPTCARLTISLACVLHPLTIVPHPAARAWPTAPGA